jgi:hypothetical protein
MNSLIHVISVLVYFIYVSADKALMNPISGASYSCSGHLNSDDCSKAFDNNVTTAWVQSINTSSPQYAVIALSTPMTVTSYQVYMLDYDYVLPPSYLGSIDYSWLVSSWKLEGSDDGIKYTNLSTVEKYFPSFSEKSNRFDLFNCSSPARYKYYRFYVTANWFMDNGYSDSDTLVLLELQLITKETSPITVPTTLPTAIIILIAVVLVIGIPLVAIFFWYSWSWYQLPDDTKSNPDDKSLQVSQEDIDPYEYTEN